MLKHELRHLLQPEDKRLLSTFVRLHLWAKTPISGGFQVARVSLCQFQNGRVGLQQREQDNLQFESRRSRDRNCANQAASFRAHCCRKPSGLNSESSTWDCVLSDRWG